MATTTYATFRDRQYELIEALTPTSLAGVPFRRHLDAEDFRLWASENPQACMRRYAIADLWDYELPPISNSDVEWTAGRGEITVAYPLDYRYGPDQRRDLTDVMREDYDTIDNSIGHRGYGNYAAGHSVVDAVMSEVSERVTVMVLSYSFRFWRAV